MWILWRLFWKKIITQEFTSQLFFKIFFTDGFNDIEPKSNIIIIKEDSKITLTYNESITDLLAETFIFTYKFVRGVLSVIKDYKYEDYNNSNGKLEINLTSLNVDTIYFTIDKEILIGKWYIYRPFVLFKINYIKMWIYFQIRSFYRKKIMI